MEDREWRIALFEKTEDGGSKMEDRDFLSSILHPVEKP
jgi:hypothetical protein